MTSKTKDNTRTDEPRKTASESELAAVAGGRRPREGRPDVRIDTGSELSNELDDVAGGSPGRRQQLPQRDRYRGEDIDLGSSEK